jgi:hypothetical protein
MARYGLDLYGSALYGAPNPTTYSVAPFRVIERTYGWMHLTWKKPGGTWSQMSLVANDFGFPVEVNDGTLLYNEVFANAATFFDHYHVARGQWVYYSIFVYVDADADWFRAGDLTVWSPASHDTGQQMYDRVSNVYRSGGFDYQENPALLAFLNLFGFQYDIIRGYANTLMSLDDPWQMNYELVPARMQELGIPIETALGPVAYRKFLANAAYLWKTKGTEACVQAVCSIVMGCNVTVGIGDNLLWNSELSDMTGGVSTWGAYLLNATSSWNENHVDFFRLTDPSLTIKAVATGNMEVGFQSPADTGMMMALPVHVGVHYTAQAFIAAGDASSHTAQVEFHWYTAAGASISVTTGSAVALPLGVPTPLGVTGTAPATAAYMTLVIRVIGAAAGVSYEVTSAQINKGSVLTAHQPGRNIRIYLEDGGGETTTTYPASDGDTYEVVTGMTSLQRAIRTARLNEILPRYLPIGATYTLIHNATPPVRYLDGDVVLIPT